MKRSLPTATLQNPTKGQGGALNKVLEVPEPKEDTPA